MTNKSKFEFDIVLKSSAGKLWRNLKNFVTTFPKALPHMYKSIEIIEGDGKSVGSVFKSTNFKPEREARSENEWSKVLFSHKRSSIYTQAASGQLSFWMGPSPAHILEMIAYHLPHTSVRQVSSTWTVDEVA
ncbi:hypothetical protein ACS0TY_009043 [Phlomoides rotata]